MSVRCSVLHLSCRQGPCPPAAGEGVRGLSPPWPSLWWQHGHHPAVSSPSLPHEGMQCGSGTCAKPRAWTTSIPPSSMVSRGPRKKKYQRSGGEGGGFPSWKVVIRSGWRPVPACCPKPRSCGRPRRGWGRETCPPLHGHTKYDGRLLVGVDTTVYCRGYRATWLAAQGGLPGVGEAAGDPAHEEITAQPPAQRY